MPLGTRNARLLNAPGIARNQNDSKTIGNGAKNRRICDVLFRCKVAEYTKLNGAALRLRRQIWAFFMLSQCGNAA